MRSRPAIKSTLAYHVQRQAITGPFKVIVLTEGEEVLVLESPTRAISKQSCLVCPASCSPELQMTIAALGVRAQT